MREIKAYHCDYCKKYSKSESYMKAHEKECFYNPETKSCATCKYYSQKDNIVHIEECIARMSTPVCTKGLSISSFERDRTVLSLRTRCEHHIINEDFTDLDE